MINSGDLLAKPGDGTDSVSVGFKGFADVCALQGNVTPSSHAHTWALWHLILADVETVPSSGSANSESSTKEKQTQNTSTK